MPLAGVGAWVSIGSSYVVEVLASCGFDWLCIDLQHGFAADGDLLPMLQAAAITRIPALVRVPGLDHRLIGRALDSGAAGVIVPMVNSAAEAREAVRACRYPPGGVRSWGRPGSRWPSRATPPGRPTPGSAASSWSRRSRRCGISTRSRPSRASTRCSSGRVTSPWTWACSRSEDRSPATTPPRSPGSPAPASGRPAGRDLLRHVPGGRPVRGDGLHDPRRDDRCRPHPGGRRRGPAGPARPRRSRIVPVPRPLTKARHREH